MKLFKGFTYTLSKKDPTFCPFRKNVRINTSKFSYKLLLLVKPRPTQQSTFKIQKLTKLAELLN